MAEKLLSGIKLHRGVTSGFNLLIISCACLGLHCYLCNCFPISVMLGSDMGWSAAHELSIFPKRKLALPCCDASKLQITTSHDAHPGLISNVRLI